MTLESNPFPWCDKCVTWHAPDEHWPAFFNRHGGDSLVAFGWPEEGSRNVGNIEDLYQHFKARLVEELRVTVESPSHYGRLVQKPASEDDRA